MADTSVKIAGIEFGNPIVAASSPLTGDVKGIARVVESGAGGVVTHTISLLPAPEPPKPVGIRGGLLHLPTWSTRTLRDWVEDILPEARKLSDETGVPLIVSVGFTAGELEAVLPEVAGFADAIELATNFLRPTGAPMQNASDVVKEVTSRHGNPFVKDPSPLEDSIATAKRLFDGPVMVKLPPLGTEIEILARASEEAGADAIVATHSFGPVMTIDIESAKPSFSGEEGHAWIGGTAMRAFALRNVFDIARSVSIPVIGSGGITSAQDAVEFLMSGASAVQVATEAEVRGARVYGSLVKKLEKWLDAHGYGSVVETIGLGVENWSRLQPHTYTVPVRYNPEECIGCGLCELSCHYNAIWMEGKLAVLDSDLCFGCGLCAVRCPTDALIMPPVWKE